MTADEYLTFFYPYFSDNSDARFVAPDIRAGALALAQSKAPACDLVPVGSEEQSQAIAHYAAYILDTRYERAKSGDPAGLVLKREKEGDVEREWMPQAKIEEINNLEGRDTPFERYKEIADRCPQASVFKLRTNRI